MVIVKYPRYFPLASRKHINLATHLVSRGLHFITLVIDEPEPPHSKAMVRSIQAFIWVVRISWFSAPNKAPLALQHQWRVLRAVDRQGDCPDSLAALTHAISQGMVFTPGLPGWPLAVASIFTVWPDATAAVAA